MVLRDFLLNIMLFDTPNSIIHKSTLESKHLHDELTKLIDDVQITVPEKLTVLVLIVDL